MADNDPTQVAAAPDQPSDHDGNRPSLLARIKVAAFVFVVILVECLIAYLYVPSRDQIAAAAQKKIAARHQSVDDAEEEDKKDQRKPTKEVDLEEFSVTAYSQYPTQHSASTFICMPRSSMRINPITISVSKSIDTEFASR